MGKVDERHSAQLVGEACGKLGLAQGFRTRILIEQGVDVIPVQCLLVPGIYACVHIMEEAPPVRREPVVDPLVVDAPEHAEVGGHRIGEFPVVGKPLLIGFEALTANIPECYGSLLEEEGKGAQRALVEVGGGEAAVLLETADALVSEKCKCSRFHRIKIK